MPERKTLLHMRSGSHLYGLSTPESDEDFVGVFMPTPSDLLGLHPVKEVDLGVNSGNTKRNVAGDVDDKRYALPQFIHLLTQNNPNITEMLFVNPENTLVTSEVFQDLQANADKLVSQRVLHTFSGYAHSQRRKLEVKAGRFKGLESAVEYVNTLGVDDDDTRRALTADEADKLNTLVQSYKGKDNNVQSFHSGLPFNVVRRLLTEELGRYGWRVNNPDFDRLGYDKKFAYHLVRILGEARELLTTGRLEFPLSGDYLPDLRAIRAGQMELPEVFAVYDRLEAEVARAGETTRLRHHPDMVFADSWLTAVLTRMIRESV